VPAKELASTTRAWYYYDVEIVLLNNLVGLHRDLRGGLVNLALISMREEEVLPLANPQGYNPNLTMRDYEDQFARTAEFSRRAVEATRSLEDRTDFYPFITLMIPVVMMADWIGNRDDMIHRYLELIAPQVRQAREAVAPEISTPSVASEAR